MVIFALCAMIMAPTCVLAQSGRTSEEKNGVCEMEAPKNTKDRRDLSKWRTHQTDPSPRCFSTYGFVFGDFDGDGDEDIANLDSGWNTPYSVGNLVGSNIFNTLLVIGTAGMVHPFGITPRLVGIDYWIMIIVSVGFVCAAVVGRRTIGRISGTLLLCMYIGYVVYLLNYTAGL